MSTTLPNFHAIRLLALKFLMILLITTILLVIVSFILYFSSRNIDIRVSNLGIDDRISSRCENTFEPIFWGLQKGDLGDGYSSYPEINHEVTSAYYGLYAAYAASIYDDEHFNFVMKNERKWTPFPIEQEVIDSIGEYKSRSYYRIENDTIHAMIVFRGTINWLGGSGVSDFSYVTQLINPYDQYKTARKIFSKFQKNVLDRYPNLKVRFYAVGHSLGGGLARHIAAAFPCVHAIAFNSSFVSNKYRLERRFDEDPSGSEFASSADPILKFNSRNDVVDIFSNRDPLTSIAFHIGDMLESRTLTFSVQSVVPTLSRINLRHRWYSMETFFPDNAHNMFCLAEGMIELAQACGAKQEPCFVYGDNSGYYVYPTPISFNLGELKEYTNIYKKKLCKSQKAK